jgi:hypothetical protein
MGFEIELDRRVTDGRGQRIKGDTELATFGDVSFRLVTDYRSVSKPDKLGYSNLELVTDPVDPLAQPDPIAPLLAGLKAVTNALYSVNGATGLPATLKDCGVDHWLTQEHGQGAIVDPSLTIHHKGKDHRIADRGSDSLFLHYTVGIPVSRLSEAIVWIRQKANAQTTNFYQTNADRAALAGTAAAELYKKWAAHRGHGVAGEDVDALKGYVALLYTQLAAVIDNAQADAQGVIKNHTVAISRVPLRRVAATLPKLVRIYLAEQAWADLLNDEDPADVNAFIAVKAREAKAVHAAKSVIGTAGIAAKDDQIAALTNLPATERLHLVKELTKDQDSTRRWLTEAATAVKEWEELANFLPLYDTVAREREEGRFPWLIVDHALVPALEGRALVLHPDQAEPDSLFGPGGVQDGGPAHDLNTGYVGDLGPAYKGVPQMTVGQLLRSALLSPGEPPIAPESIFGGMREVPDPDLVHVHGQPVHLVPLELRSHIAGSVTWVRLEAALTELVAFLKTLMPPPPPAPPVQRAAPAKRPADTPAEGDQKRHKIQGDPP